MQTPDEARLFTIRPVSPEAIAQTHERRIVEVTDAPTLSYSLPVPKQMFTSTALQAEPQSLMQPQVIGVFGLDAELEGPNLIACAQTLAWEVDPLEWLRFGWVHAGWRIIIARCVPSATGLRYEIGALKTTAGKTQVRRTLATRSGGRLVRLDARAPIDQWPAWRDTLWTSMEGMCLATRKLGGIETLTCQSGPLLRFATPASWIARGRENGRRGVVWTATPTQNTVRPALLYVGACESSGASDGQARRGALLADVATGGIIRKTPLSRVEREDFRELLPGWLGQWTTDLEHEGRRVRLLLAQREEAGICVDYALLTPPPGPEHIDWMRGTRAFDIAQSTTSVRPRANTVV